MSSSVMARIEEIKGRGRTVVAAKPLRAGEVVLRDSPILLYSARPLIPSQHNHRRRQHLYCSNCFRIILNPRNPSVVPCPSCGDESKDVLFCSPNCRSAALASSHTPWVCHALRRLYDFPGWPLQEEERQLQARFLVAGYNLALVSPSHFRCLLSLQGGNYNRHHYQEKEEDNCGKEAVAAASFLHSLISSLCPPPTPTAAGGYSFCLELTVALLAKDKLNAFGLMEYLSTTEEHGGGNGGDCLGRTVRAYGIYPTASLFNHDCLPNACRFDYIDGVVVGDKKDASLPANNTDISVRMIHDVPEGREICLSYFPVNLNYRERQQRLKEDYGFVCCCDRCQVEANWSDGEEYEEEEEEQMAIDEDDDDQVMGVPDNKVVKDEGSDFPHAYFFLRYMCSRKNCWGTLAPMHPPSNGATSMVMECNVCGTLKNDEVEEEEAAYANHK